VKQLRRLIRFSWLSDSKQRTNFGGSTELLEDDAGATALEYGLLAAAIAGVLIIVAFFFGSRLGNEINNVAAHLN